MALRIHPVAEARWVQLAESRHRTEIIDLTTEPESNAPPAIVVGPDRSHRDRDEYARIRAELDRLTAQLASNSR